MWIVLMAIAADAAPQVRPQLPGWLSGCWEQRTGADWAEECWTRPRGGMMIGSSRTGSGDRLDQWEVMQIATVETDDPAVPRMTFSAAPNGTGRTTFDWVPSPEPGVTFVNRAHDYPQRIRYWRDGSHLMAEIALADGSRARRWRYSRLR